MSDAATDESKVIGYLDGEAWRSCINRSSNFVNLYVREDFLVPISWALDPTKAGCGIAKVDVRFVEWVVPPDDGRRYTASHEVKPSGLIEAKDSAHES